MNKKSSSKIKIFIVDDQSVSIEGFKRIIESIPKKDLQFVGSHISNTPDLPNRIRKSGAKVAIIDIVLGKRIPPERIEGETSGIAAIEAVREKLGKDIKILACSVYPQFREKAFRAGASGYFHKGDTAEEIQTAIYEVVGKSYYSAGITRITGVELFPKSTIFDVIGEGVIGNRQETQKEKFAISKFRFAFLYYLAMERKEGQRGWIFKEGDGFRFKEETLWHQISKELNTTWGNRYHIDTRIVAQWCTEINTEVKDFLKEAQPLIKVPDRNSPFYSLNSDIASQSITIR